MATVNIERVKERRHQIMAGIKMMLVDGKTEVSSRDLKNHVAVKAIAFEHTNTFPSDLDAMAKRGEIMLRKEGTNRLVSLIGSRRQLGVVKPVSSPIQSVLGIIPVQVKQGVNCVRITMPSYIAVLYLDGTVEQLPHEVKA